MSIDWWVAAEPVEAACPACSHAGPHQIRLAVDGLSLLFCSSCSSAFWATRASADYVSAIANSAMYYRAELEDSLEAPFRDLEALSAAAQSAFAADAPLNFVDVGCGVGFAADMAKNIFGWNAVGLDPAVISEFAASEWGMPTVKGTFPADNQGPAPELVFCSEVIEHVDDPGQFLLDLHAGMAPDALLLLTTPPVELISPTTDPDELMQVLFIGEHLQYFSVEAMNSMLERAGFTPLVVRTDGARRSFLAAKGKVSVAAGPSWHSEPSRLEAYLTLRSEEDIAHARIFGSRAYGFAVNAGDIAKADWLWVRLARVYESWLGEPLTPRAIDQAGEIVSGQYIDSVDRYPASLPLIAYLRGMHLLVKGEADAESLQWLRSADALARSWEVARQTFAPISPRDGHLRMIPIWVAEQVPVALTRLSEHLSSELLVERARAAELQRHNVELERTVVLLQETQVEADARLRREKLQTRRSESERHLNEIRNESRQLSERLSEAEERRNHLGDELTREHERYRAILNSRSMRLGMSVTAPVRNRRGAGRIREVSIAEAGIDLAMNGGAELRTEDVRASKFGAAEVRIDLAPVTDLKGTKVALIAGWDARGRISAATEHLAKGFAGAGFAPVLVSSRRHDSDWIATNQQRLRETFCAVLSSDHDARDFRSWQIAFDSLNGLANASELILANDSVIGALFDPSDFLAALTYPSGDVRGALESHSPVPHLQSWLVWFGPRVMADQALQRYLARYEPGLDKRQLIETMEIPLALWFGMQGYEVGSVISALTVATGSSNPATEKWQRLLELGMPYIKRELLTNPELVQRFPRAEVMQTLEKFAVDVDVQSLLDDALGQLG